MSPQTDEGRGKFSTALQPLYAGRPGCHPARWLGEIVDVEVRLNAETPRDLFPFPLQESRVEILVHSVHHLDLVRHFLGDPRRVYARAVKNPRFPKLAGTRSSNILDHGDMIRCCLSIHHCHLYGLRHVDASIGIEGCAVATLGLRLDYPRGRPDKLEVIGHRPGSGPRFHWAAGGFRMDSPA